MIIKKLIRYFSIRKRIKKAIDCEDQMATNAYFGQMESHNKGMSDSVDFWTLEQKRHKDLSDILKGFL